MQKLERRNTYTPRGAPQASGNCGTVIKQGSAVGPVLQNLKTRSNNSDVDLLSGKREQDLRVPVINMRGEALMPTTHGKARRILEQGNAKVLKRKPFTIQLQYASGETTQPITLGIDAGYKHVGFSAVTHKAELLCGTLELRTDIPKKLMEKSMYRRNKRNKLWHRPPRFLNRVGSKKKGWLAPSIQHKLDSHIRLIEHIKSILPVSDIVVEVASFDIQKIKNPGIEGDDYQHGEQMGFWNTREYVLHRDNHTCQGCKGKSKDKILQVHHINGKSKGATDRPEEFVTVCVTCHDNHHSGKKVLKLNLKKIKNFKPETFMTVVRWKLVNKLKCKHTFGHITKHYRIKSVLPKTHANDAFIIAGGSDQAKAEPYCILQVRRNNRSIQKNRKGFKPSIRRQRYSLQPHDLINYKGETYNIKGTHCLGSRVILDNKKSVLVSEVELIKHGKGLCYA